MRKAISGFSGLTKEEKIDWLADQHFSNPSEGKIILRNYWNDDEKLQQLHDEFIENTITNFYLPLGVAPNFLVNGSYHTIPMAIEESSVVAAAARAAKFWSTRGGFTATVIDTEKIGQVHFTLTYDDDGERAEGATVTAFATHRDGTKSEPVTLTPASAPGAYLAVLDVPMAGDWTVRIESTTPTASLEVPAVQVFDAATTTSSVIEATTTTAGTAPEPVLPDDDDGVMVGGIAAVVLLVAVGTAIGFRLARRRS